MHFELFSARNIIIGLLLLGLIAFFSEFYSIFIIVFSAFIVYAGLKPSVDYLERKNINRGLAVAFVFMGMIALLTFTLSLIFNATYQEIKTALQEVEFNSENVIGFVENRFPVLAEPVTNVITQVEKVASNEVSLEGLFNQNILGSFNGVGVAGLKIAGGVVSAIFNVFLIVFISLYMILPKKDFFVAGINYFIKDEKKQKNWATMFGQLKVGLGSWIVGQIALMFFVGLITFIVVSVPGLFVQDYDLGRFALLISLFAAILEALPNLGPTITLVFAVLLAFLTGSSVAIVVYILISFILIQQFEGVFLVPYIMRKAIDLNPIVSIVVIIAGFSLTGSAVGALVSIPFAGCVNIIYKNYREGKLS